ncbi:MAG: ribonuclease Z [Capsulimonadaceae bacterium]
MKLTFLGTGSASPTLRRNVSALAVQFQQSGAWWLFDCGEGTQHQVQRTPLRPSRLSRIFVTHLHGDHIFGLPGLLASRSLQDSATSPVEVLGPPGVAEFLRSSLRLSRSGLGYPLTIRELPAPEAGQQNVVEGDEESGIARVEYAPMDHGMPCYGYAIVEADRTGRLDAARLAAEGVPFGPLYGRLKAGETVTLPDGRVIDGAEYVDPPQIGRRVVICGDSRPSAASIALAGGADVLVHEGTFMEADAPLAAEVGHSTSAAAARIASSAGVRTLILTHFSPRYENSESAGMSQLLAEAAAIFPHTLPAQDLWTFDVPRRGGRL